MKTRDAFTIRVADWASDDEALRLIRFAVFVLEQKVPESLEWDGLDEACEHAIAEDASHAPIGCGRLLPDGHIGRLAVLREWRGSGVGSALLERLVTLARTRGHARLLLNAQTHAIPFYARHGFAVTGEPFDEAGIPHIVMERVVAPAQR
jgi:predicted GNAT family N-acyltransferase